MITKVEFRGHSATSLAQSEDGYRLRTSVPFAGFLFAVTPVTTKPFGARPAPRTSLIAFIFVPIRAHSCTSFRESERCLRATFSRRAREANSCHASWDPFSPAAPISPPSFRLTINFSICSFLRDLCALRVSKIPRSTLNPKLSTLHLKCAPSPSPPN